MHRVKSIRGALTFPISLWSLYWFSWIQSCRGEHRGGQVSTVDQRRPPWIHHEKEPFPPCRQNQGHGALYSYNVSPRNSTTSTRKTEIHSGKRNKMFHMCGFSVYVMKTYVFVCVCAHAPGHFRDAASDAVGRFLFAVFKSISVLLFN